MHLFVFIDQLSFKKGAIIYVTEMKEDENVLFGTIISKKKLRRKPKVPFLFHSPTPFPFSLAVSHSSFFFVLLLEQSGWFPANYTILTDAPN
jgi:hypothetical protein